MTDQERRHVTDLLAAHETLIHWCETLTTAHADLVELTSNADLLNLVETDEHEQRLIPCARRRLRGGGSFCGDAT